MNAKRKSLIVMGFVTTAFLAVLIAYGPRYMNPLKEKSPSPVPAEQRVKQPVIKNLSDGVRTQDGHPVPIYDSVSTYAELEAAVSKSSIDPGQKAEYLRTAAIFCESVRALPQPKPKRDPTPSDLYYKKFSTNFCKDFTGSSDAQIAELMKHPDSDVAMAHMLLSENANKPKDTKLVADNLVRTSKQPNAVLTAAGLLVSEPIGSWDLGKNLTSSSQEINQLTDAQWLGVRMLACDYSGGCGADGFYTMMECVNFQACRPGITLMDVWRENTAAPIYRLANKIHGELALGTP